MRESMRIGKYRHMAIPVRDSGTLINFVTGVVAEFQIAADMADISVLYFSGAAKFWSLHAKS